MPSGAALFESGTLFFLLDFDIHHEHDHDHDGDDIDGSSPPDCTEDNAEYEAENEKADDDEKSNV